MEGKSYDERLIWLKRRLWRTQLAVALALLAAPLSAGLSRWWPRSVVVSQSFVLQDEKGRVRAEWDARNPAAPVERPIPADARR